MQTDAMVSMTKRITLTTALLAALYCARRYYRNWGATKAESQMVLPGDTLVHDPVMQTTEAVHVDASASAVWACLMQFAEARDESGRRPEMGDVIHIATGGRSGPPNGMRFSVADIVPEKHIVLHGVQAGSRRNAVLSLHLQPHWDDRVRLLARVRFGLRYPGEVLVMELARPLIALGTRAWLLSVKRRAERPVPTDPDRIGGENLVPATTSEVMQCVMPSR
ncbi:hypothetical protein A5672_01130 [Mycobacterium alsense]|uniref:SRPBCC family protein n=1 Tax=Mycobacterium alsense TaxID=324058 RepID=A0ABD6P544_9MYCO|nr:hypothetical protein [Mycobacterium alsense]OBG39430.1 hypothetical protein A5672_01130 [Mycobacterium alsense]OBI93817.1 hypothetical protein A5660_13070 [Mycobacterium alsense]